MRLWLPCLLAVWLASVSVEATSYLPVTFGDLVKQADVIFVGDVVDVHSFAMRVRSNTVIKARVTFRVSDPVYGTTSLVEVFDFLGGEVGGGKGAIVGFSVTSGGVTAALSALMQK